MTERCRGVHLSKTAAHRGLGNTSEQNIRALFSMMTTISAYGPCSSFAVCSLWVYHLAEDNPGGGQALPGLHHLGPLVTWFVPMLTGTKMAQPHRCWRSTCHIPRKAGQRKLCLLSKIKPTRRWLAVRCFAFKLQAQSFILLFSSGLFLSARCYPYCL